MKLHPENDRRFNEEIQEMYKNRDLPDGIADLLEEFIKSKKEGALKLFNQGVNESKLKKIIVDGIKRPSFIIKNNTFNPSSSKYWSSILSDYTGPLSSKIPSIGRLELMHSNNLDYVGTGFLVDENIVMTNRHVTIHFVKKIEDRHEWKKINGKTIKARIDYLEEEGASSNMEIDFTEILYIEPYPGPDVAFFRVEMGSNPNPLELSSSSSVNDAIVTIGYPTRKEPQPEFIEKFIKLVFGNKFEIKRLSPGFIKNQGANVLKHDCSTLWGNSGSPIIDIETCKVIGMHRGPNGRNNSGVSAGAIKKCLAKIK